MEPLIEQPLSDRCKKIEIGDKIEVENVDFESLFVLKQTMWWSLRITATLNRDVEMTVWNGKHPVDENTTKHTCFQGTPMRVWMVSRFGDVGVTDNLDDPSGYDARIDPSDLSDWSFERTR